MAIIDTFLKLMVTQKADILRVRPEDAPTLIKDDESSRLSMPALSEEMVNSIVAEVLGPDAGADRGSAEGTYRLNDHPPFHYRVSVGKRGYEIEMRCLDESPPSSDAGPVDVQRTEETAHHSDDQVMAAVRSTLNLQKRRAPTAGAHVEYKAATDPISSPADGPLSHILNSAFYSGASDIFLSSQSVPRMRVDGALVAIDAAVTTNEAIEALLPSDTHRAELSTSGSVDFGITWALSSANEPTGQHCRFRVNLFRHAHGLGAALRLVRPDIPSLKTLNLPKDLYELCGLTSGLVLVTGASGSGKSSTLAALIDHINRTSARHIITIEDPIEFAYQSDKSLIHQRELGTHVESFSAGLRAAVRENPDVILVGEMRDLSTISAALTASETGHLVFSTLHTGNAASAVTRIIDAFPGHQQAHVRIQIASSLRAVVAQRLLPAARGEGRVPALQKLIVTHGVANQIREGREHQVQSAIQTGGDDGMITFERSLAGLLRSGSISRATALANADDTHALLKLIGA